MRRSIIVKEAADTIRFVVENFPLELIAEIMKHLTVAEMRRFLLVNTGFNNLSANLKFYPIWRHALPADNFDAVVKAAIKKLDDLPNEEKRKSR